MLRGFCRGQLGALVGKVGIFNYIASKLRERFGLVNTKVRPLEADLMAVSYDVSHWLRVPAILWNLLKKLCHVEGEIAIP